MWHAARKQEKMIRVMMVDYQKRAGRRREYYECIKQDPNQFLRVYGRSMKVHIDPALAAVADGPQIMQPWQGDSEVQIDRYDVRSHIDYIAPPIQNAKDNTDLEENRCNYERYRILVQNDCAGVSEDQCLQQIYHDELFGSSDSNKSEEDKKRKLAEKKAAIGFIYDDGSSGIRVPDFKKEMEEEVSDEEIDLDNILDIDMLTEEQEQVLNGLSVEYGMEGNDYSEFLQLDRDEMEALRAVKQIEEEKAQFSGRKSRRERRAFKERRLRNRKLSPPSYATKINTASVPTYEQLRGSSSSRSRSPPGTGVIQFITSFGNNGGRRSSDDEKQLQGPSLPAPRDPNKPIVGPKLPDRGRRSSKSPRRRSRSPRRRSRSQRRRSRSPRRRSRKRSRSNRRSRSRDRNRGRRSRSRSEGRSNGYRRDYSRRLRRSRSLSRSRSRLSSRSPSSSSSCSKPSRSCSRSRSRGSKGTSTQTPIKKYRRSSLSSKSESDDDDGKKDSSRIKKDSSGSKSEQNRSVPGKGSVASSKTSTMTPQERLKRRMQMALTKQFKADKKAQIEKQTKEEQMKQDREEELRQLSAQMRQRDRERRHREREERDRLEAEMDRPARKRSRSSERSRSRKRSRRSSSRGSRSRRSRSRESGSRRSRRRSSPDSARTNRPKLVDY